MEKPNATKLLIKPGNTVFITGDNDMLRALVDPLPENTTIANDPAQAEVAILFATDRVDLDAKLEANLVHLNGAKAIWIGYPKGGRADINRDSIWRRVEELGWTLIGNVSLSTVWSAVRLKTQT